MLLTISNRTRCCAYTLHSQPFLLPPLSSLLSTESLNQSRLSHPTLPFLCYPQYPINHQSSIHSSPLHFLINLLLYAVHITPPLCNLQSICTHARTQKCWGRRCLRDAHPCLTCDSPPGSCMPLHSIPANPSPLHSSLHFQAVARLMNWWCCGIPEAVSLFRMRVVPRAFVYCTVQYSSMLILDLSSLSAFVPPPPSY